MIECILYGIKNSIEAGVNLGPHEWEEVERKPAIIIATEDSFRVANSYQHKPNERVYRNATLIKYRCKICGKEEEAWEQ